MLNGFDSRDQLAMASQFAWRVKSFRLRLDPQPKKSFAGVIERQLQLLVAHFTKF